MALSKFSWRELRARPFRALLTLLSISIGVGAVVAVLLATANTQRAQSEMLQAVTGRAQIEVVANSARGFSYKLVKEVEEVDGVDLAVPSISRFATVFIGERQARTQVMGIDPRIDQQIREYKVTAGKLPEKNSEMMLDASFAQSLEAKPGDSVKLLGRSGLLEFQLSGLVAPTGSSSLSLGGAGYIVLPAAGHLFRSGANIDQILIQVEKEADIDSVIGGIKERLGDTATVRVPRTTSDMAAETMYATQNGLRMAVAFALLIASFIIYNTFQMAVGERRRQLGVLRAIGATRKQVSRMILREAFWLSVMGASVGCVLGAWGAGFLNGATEAMLQVELPQLEISFGPFAIAVVVGMGVSMLGAILPARRASKIQPVEAMRSELPDENANVIRRTLPLGIIAFPVGLLTIWSAMQGWTPVGTDVVGIVMVLIGFVLLIPCLLDASSRLLVSLIIRWVGIESKLAQRQLMRHVGRSTLTIGVLFVAISTCTGMAGNIMDNVDNVRNWYSRAIVGDFFVRASMPDFATGASVDLPPDIDTQLQQFSGIESIEPMRFINAQSGDETIVVVAREFTKEPENYFDLVAAADTNSVADLNNGGTVIGSVLAQRKSLSVGDSIPVETENGTVELKVSAITNEYLAGGLTVYMSLEQSAKILGAEGASVLVVNAKRGELATLQKQLQEFCVEEGLILQSYADIVSFIDDMVNGVIASLWMLLALGCVIAAMGLVNTLTMNILEQTREIGMLRVVAMTRQQVRRMIVAQASLLGILGLVPGVLAGVFVAYAISQSSLAVLGHNITFHFRPGLLLGCLAIGLVIVLISSLIPAERAARLELSSALQYE